MEQTLEQQIQERLAQLPADVRNAITSNELGAKVHAVGTKNQLHIDQVGALETAVYLAMLGFTQLERLPKTLQDELNVSPEAAQKVASDVTTDIFGPIRESMKKFVAERAAPQGNALAQGLPKASPYTTAPTKPSTNPDLHKADVMLTEKTVSLAPLGRSTTTGEAKAEENPAYKADPYREPV